MSDVVVREPTVQDLEAAVRLLEDEGLPVADLTLDQLALAADADESLGGVIGLQRLGTIGLLRSLVVTPGGRGRGIGRQLVDELEALAAREGIAELWLLTIDADPFFERLDYVRRDRGDAPAAVQATAEFSSLCPGDAIVMSKALV